MALLANNNGFGLQWPNLLIVIYFIHVVYFEKLFPKERQSGMALLEMNIRLDHMFFTLDSNFRCENKYGLFLVGC